MDGQQWIYLLLSVTRSDRACSLRSASIRRLTNRFTMTLFPDDNKGAIQINPRRNYPRTHHLLAYATSDDELNAAASSRTLVLQYQNEYCLSSPFQRCSFV